MPLAFLRYMLAVGLLVSFPYVAGGFIERLFLKLNNFTLRKDSNDLVIRVAGLI